MSFTPITIDELQPIGNTQKPDAQVAVQQNGRTFKGPIRPNPPRQVNVTSQAQLETEFGENIEIPDNDRITIVIDDDFTLNKPFKGGLNSTLEIIGATADTLLIYSGTETMAQNTNPANLMVSFLINNLKLLCTSNVDMYDLRCSESFFSEFIRAEGFKSTGFIQALLVSFKFFRITGFSNGVRVNNAFAFILLDGLMIQPVPPGMTFVSFTTTLPFPVAATISNLRTNSDGVGDSLFFLNPNAPAGTSYNIQNSRIGTGDFYQVGTDIAATANAASVSNTQFNITAHGLVVDRAVVLKDFTTFPGYNGTFYVTAVNDANSVDIGVGFLGVDSTGTMNASSLDQTDNRVDAQSNPGEPDSMSQAESRTSSTLDLIPTAATFVAIVDDTPVAGDFIQDVATERFTVDTSTGIITYTGNAILAATISFSLTVIKSSGGGTDTATITLFQNTTQQTKSDQLTGAYSTSTSQSVAYSGGLFLINPGDTFDLRINTSSSDPITISGLTVLISQQ